MQLAATRAFRVAAALIWAGTWLAAAETKVDSLIGEVTTVDAAARRLTLKADNGNTVEVPVGEGASVLRAKPGAKSLAEAAPSTLEEVAVGDRVLVRGARSADGASLAARQVVVMAKNDIAQKQEAERADWRKRGVLGTVTAVDPAGGEITLQVGRGPLARTLVIPTTGRTVVFRRYAPDSIKFTDAKPSSLAEVKIGDELRALGDRSPEAENGAKAVTLLDDDCTVHVLVADLQMPEVAGEEMVRQLREKRPDLRVLYVTGHVDRLFSERPVLREREAFVEKPFTSKALLEALSLLLYRTFKRPK